jgi:tRNA threonylcarbamoyladenosine biosynthesis protein TsaB
MNSLALEAAAGEATIAVLADERVVAETRVSLQERATDPLLPAVARVLADAGIAASQLQRVCCGDGPGGFTALRLAAATAKGLVRGSGAELWVAGSLALVVAGADDLPADGEYLAMLDALRGEYYAAQITVHGGRVTSCSAAWRAAREEALATAVSRQLTAIGPHESLAARPHARGWAHLEWTSELVRRVDPGAWEPQYGRQAEAQVRWEATHRRPLETESGTGRGSATGGNR